MHHVDAVFTLVFVCLSCTASRKQIWSVFDPSYARCLPHKALQEFLCVLKKDDQYVSTKELLDRLEKYMRSARSLKNGLCQIETERTGRYWKLLEIFSDEVDSRRKKHEQSAAASDSLLLILGFEPDIRLDP
ncbi:hypothetical protein BCR33DRAFT_781509 [Rhizoclosmatium globosum]|uniref:Uncharacterized protein n=1 Tax=Rhizoclosmatium globosum TaxID=329046 RepID=A0A1Y2CSI7_9FUNG|nr:hypothetical protein BCR33DRAFT_781509 [Rhizoclosmatium globosum]|eukprot:ORY49998.1 hypothetical protein BCR33DRAFT_781509 [Rhizoclosmatium globosum]